MLNKLLPIICLALVVLGYESLKESPKRDVPIFKTSKAKPIIPKSTPKPAKTQMPLRKLVKTFQDGTKVFKIGKDQVTELPDGTKLYLPETI